MTGIRKYFFRIKSPDNYDGSLRIIIPTSNLKNKTFRKAIYHLSVAKLPSDCIISVIVSSGPGFRVSNSLNDGLMDVIDEDILLLNDDCYVDNLAIFNAANSVMENDGVIGGVLRYGDGSIQHNGGTISINKLGIFRKDLANHAPFFALRQMKKARDLGVNYIRTYHYNTLETGRIDYVMGAFSYIPNKAFRKIGLLDDNFVNGFEDLDYCLRAIKNGLSVRVQHDATAIHEEHVSLREVKSNYFENLKIFNEKWDKKTIAEITRR